MPPRVTDKDAAGPVQATMLPERRVRVKQDDSARNARVYYLEFTDGERSWRESLWSVTTILKVLDKPAIVHWAAKATARAAFEQLRYLPDDLERFGMDDAVGRLAEARFKQQNNGKAIGEAVHLLVDAHIRGASPPQIKPDILPEALPRFEQFQRWEEEYQPTYRAAEATVFDADYGWAGTLDFIAEIGRRGEGLVDIKNTNPSRDGKPGVYIENVLQVAAYANAKEIAGVRGAWIVPQPMYDVQWGAVLWLYPGRYAFIETDISEDPTYRAFLLAGELYRYLDGPGKRGRLGEQSPATFGILPTPEQNAAAIAAQEAAAASNGHDAQDPAPAAPAMPADAPASAPAVINEQQRRHMLAVGADHGLDHAGVKEIVRKVTGATSTKAVPAGRFDEVLGVIQALGDPGPER